MQTPEQRKEIANQAFGIVEVIRDSCPYPLDLHDLDWAVFATLEENVEFGGIEREEADTIYNAFSQIFLHKGRID